MLNLSKLLNFPINFGRQRDEILAGLRSLPMNNYLILYVVIGHTVHCLEEAL